MSKEHGQTRGQTASAKDPETAQLRRAYGKLHKLVVDGNLLFERINETRRPDQALVEQTRNLRRMASEKLMDFDLTLLFDFEGAHWTGRNCVACRDCLLSAMKNLEEAVVLDALTGFCHHSVIWADGIQSAISTFAGSQAIAQRNPALREWLEQIIPELLSNPASYVWNEEGELLQLGEGGPLASMVVDDEPLSERERWVLKALLLKKAFNSDNRLSTAVIAELAGGSCADPNAYKTPVSHLAENDFLETREGRGGGVWLTSKGQARAAKL